MTPIAYKMCLGTRGIKLFKCLKCGSDSTNYSNGVKICYECCAKNNICQVCGKEIKNILVK